MNGRKIVAGIHTSNGILERKSPNIQYKEDDRDSSRIVLFFLLGALLSIILLVGFVLTHADEIRAIFGL